MARMKIFFIILLWLIIAGILVTGVTLAVKGTFWLLIAGLVVFILGLVKYGILNH